MCEDAHLHCHVLPPRLFQPKRFNSWMAELNCFSARPKSVFILTLEPHGSATTNTMPYWIWNIGLTESSKAETNWTKTMNTWRICWSSHTSFEDHWSRNHGIMMSHFTVDPIQFRTQRKLMLSSGCRQAKSIQDAELIQLACASSINRTQVRSTENMKEHHCYINPMCPPIINTGNIVEILSFDPLSQLLLQLPEMCSDRILENQVLHSVKPLQTTQYTIWKLAFPPKIT